MRSILLHMHSDSGQDLRFKAAADLARLVDGHLTCIQPIAYPTYLAVDPMAYAGASSLYEALDAEAVKFRLSIEPMLAREAVRWEWKEALGDAATAIVSESRLADLVVLSQAGHGSPEPLTIVGDVALHARTPVLAVAVEGTEFDAGGQVMVAWNGSHEAANALRASVSLLAHAEAVHLVTIGDQPEAYSASQAVRYLAGHGIAVQTHERPHGGRSIGETLFAAAQDLEAGYVVLGAYGHSRFRERLIGGVTRWMLDHSTISLFLAH
jgi:nucleotide-binding universal stress UspA family protein